MRRLYQAKQIDDRSRHKFNLISFSSSLSHHIMNAFVGQTFQINQLINIHQVVEIVGVARSTVYAMMDEYSPYYDPTFPKKVKITQNRIGWSAFEIHQWIESKLASRE